MKHPNLRHREFFRTTFNAQNKRERRWAELFAFLRSEFHDLESAKVWASEWYQSDKPFAFNDLAEGGHFSTREMAGLVSNALEGWDAPTQGLFSDTPYGAEIHWSM